MCPGPIFSICPVASQHSASLIKVENCGLWMLTTASDWGKCEYVNYVFFFLGGKMKEDI